ESDPRQEEIDVVTITDDVLPPSVENEDSNEEVDAVDYELIISSKILNMSILREFSFLFAESEDTIFDPGISD
nr:hypothetical protein [Tanacetum cinerariifolium]